MGTSFTHFLQGMAEEIPHTVVYGTVVSILEDVTSAPLECKNLFKLLMDKAKYGTSVVGRKVYENGILMAAFCGEDLQVLSDYVLGWNPIGKELEVTEMVGDTCVAKLNGMPATNVYEHYLQVKPDENFVYNISEFPLAVKRNGCLIARVQPVMRY